MKKTIAKHYWDACRNAFSEDVGRKAFEFPDWLRAFKNEKRSAEEAFIALEAALLMILTQPGQVIQSYPALSADFEMELHEHLTAWGVMDRIITEPRPYSAIASALAALSEYTRFLGGNLKQLETHETYTSAALHAIVTEATQRDPTAVTPIDVADFMKSCVPQGEGVHIYALDGLGLLYAFRQSVKAQLVGTEFGKRPERVIPPKLENIYAEAQTWFRTAEFVNREFIDLEWRFGHEEITSDVLLVNAARFDHPFFDAEGLAEEKIPNGAGALNHCLKAGYSQVVVLVSNHFLTAGQGIAKKILDHCINHGLSRVIQLPMGVLGFKSKQHSLLVFSKQGRSREIEFSDFSDPKNTKPPEKGFGHPRRATTIMGSLDRTSHNATTVPVSEIDSYGKTFGKGKKLLSFEVGQFLKLDALSHLRGKCTFMRIHDFMEVFRAHHIEENSDADRTNFTEIGASSITEYGLISGGRQRTCSTSALERRRAQVLQEKDIALCFRGSPDSFGKVGLYLAKKSERAVPNQSFVILRAKKDTSLPLMPEVLVWWLNSDFAQQQLKLKSISPDVMRISPSDIGALEVPVGPAGFLENEQRKAALVLKDSQEIEDISTRIQSVQATAWDFGK